MSRGFVKEGDQEEPPFIPPRSSLPPGVTNYVTPGGMKALEKERRELEKQRSEMTAENDTEHRRVAAIIDGKHRQLMDRINSARVIRPDEQAEDEVRFGALVRFQDAKGSEPVEFQIVGVDEADVKEKKIAFVSPIAKALTGKKKGEMARLQTEEETREFKILNITYPDPRA